MRKSEDFLEFSKNEKVTKSNFCVFAYVYEVFCCSGRSESQSCVLEHFGGLWRSKSPKSDFLIRVRRFGGVLEPEMHPFRFWALLGVALSFWGAEGARPLTEVRGR